MRFAGKVAVVTGGSSGIGAATARLLVRDGAKVVIGDLGADDALLAELGDCARFLPTDVANQAQVKTLVDEAVAHFGRIDYLFNNAGIGEATPTDQLDEATLHRVFNINTAAIVYGCGAAIGHMRRQGGGAIVNTASIAGLFGDFAMPAYNLTKGAVVNYTRALATELTGQNIRVNCVCPGVIDTPIVKGIMATPPVREAWASVVPLARFGRPEEIAEVVAFLLSDAASYVNGAIVAADGGVTAQTGLADVRPHLAAIMESMA